MTAKRIAFVELWRLGDAVLATAGLRALRLACPDAEIALLAHPVAGDPLIRSGDYDTFIPFSPFWTRKNYGWDKYLPWTIDYGHVVGTWRRLRAFRADTYLLFRGDPREQAFFASVGGGEVVDARYQQRIFPGTRLLSRLTGVRRYREYLHHVTQWAGADVTAFPHIAAVPTPIETDHVLVHPGASWALRQWPPERTATLIDVLADAGHKVYLVGGPGEQPLIQQIHQATRSRPEVRYPSLEELYVLTRGARAVICQNSSELHIAEALGTPCVVLNGPTDVVRFGAWRSSTVSVCKSLELPCHPCIERRCIRPAGPCINDIGITDVVSALRTLGVLPVAQARSHDASAAASV